MFKNLLEQFRVIKPEMVKDKVTPQKVAGLFNITTDSMGKKTITYR